jgi:hypothetical protein
MELAKGLAVNRSLTLLEYSSCFRFFIYPHLLPSLSGNVIVSTGLRSLFKALNDNRRSELKLLEYLIHLFLLKQLPPPFCILSFCSLSGNGIEREGCQYIVSYLKDNNSLRALILDDNSLGTSTEDETETGVHLLANIIPNLKKLAHLRFCTYFFFFERPYCSSLRLVYKTIRSLIQPFPNWQSHSKRTKLCHISGIYCHFLPFIAPRLSLLSLLSSDRLQWNLITADGGATLAKGLAKNSTLMFVSLVGNRIPPPTAGFIRSASLLSRGSVVPPCELDIPWGAIENQETFLAELQNVQYL